MNSVRIFYIYRFFQMLIFAYVIERLFWEQRGMTIALVVYTEMIYALTVILCEVPSGMLADRLGRKKMIIISAILGCLEFWLLLYSSTFWHFAVVVVLAGVSYAASSGAENALLYETLVQHQQALLFEKHIGRLNACELIAAIIAALCGSLLATRFGFELNYWLSLVSMVICLVAALLFKEPIRRNSLDTPPKFRQYFATAINFFRQHPHVCLVVIAAMVTGASLNYLDEFWQLYLDRLQIPVLFFGLLSAGMMLMMLPGNLIAYQLKNRFHYRTLLLVVISIFACGFIYISMVQNSSSLIAICLIYLVAGVMEPITMGYLHHRIKHDSMRATIDSFQSLGTNSAMMTMGIGFGYFSSLFDIFGGFAFIALVCSLCLCCFLIALHKIDLK